MIEKLRGTLLKKAENVITLVGNHEHTFELSVSQIENILTGVFHDEARLTQVDRKPETNENYENF